jgi:hypothetical protein
MVRWKHGFPSFAPATPNANILCQILGNPLPYCRTQIYNLASESVPIGKRLSEVYELGWPILYFSVAEPIFSNQDTNTRKLRGKIRLLFLILPLPLICEFNQKN